MPANPERRALIMDTAIEILAEVGAGGLTHRTVDTQAMLPAGTTSNFFRTRLALLRPTAERVAELHWQWVDELRAELRQPLDRTSLAVLLGRMLATPDKATKTRDMARYELFLAGRRQPELAPAMADIYEAAMQGAAAVISSAGMVAEPERVRLMARLLNGLMVDQLTLPDKALDVTEATWLVDRLLNLVFGSPARLPQPTRPCPPASSATSVGAAAEPPAMR